MEIKKYLKNENENKNKNISSSEFLCCLDDSYQVSVQFEKNDLTGGPCLKRNQDDCLSDLVKFWNGTIWNLFFA